MAKAKNPGVSKAGKSRPSVKAGMAKPGAKKPGKPKKGVNPFPKAKK